MQYLTIIPAKQKEEHLLNKYPVGIYVLKANNRNARTRCEICSKLTIKTPGVFISNFEYILHLVLLFILLTLSR